MRTLIRIVTAVMLVYGAATHLEGLRQNPVVVFETGPGGPGAIVQVIANRGLALARLGHGGVHHVAFRAPNDAEHAAWQRRIEGLGVPVTPVIDRYYFRSIYFREPGGILFEIATDGPGFATDEDVAHLGEGLALPSFLEPHRAEIEAGLRPLTTSGRYSPGELPRSKPSMRRPSRSPHSSASGCACLS